MSQAFDYPGIRDNVTNPLLTQFGKACTVVEEQPGAYDPVTDIEQPPTIINHTGLCVQGKFKRDETIGGLVPQQGEIKLILLTDDLYQPDTNDVVQFSSVNYRVRSSEGVDPSGASAVLFICLTVPEYG